MTVKRYLFTTLTLFVAVAACALPGLQTTSAPPPTLTADTGRIATMVAGTVSAVVAQTEQFIPTPLLATVATEAFIPTPAANPSETPTPEATSSPSQSVLTRLENGSYLFTDELAYYKVTLPAGWLFVRNSEKEYLDAFSLGESANTHVQQALLGIQNETPNVLRLFGIDTQAAHIQNEFVTEMRFVLDEEVGISLETDEELQAIAAEIPNAAATFRFEPTSVKLFTTANGVDFGVIESKSMFTNAAGVDVPLYQKKVFFNVPVGTQSITLTTIDSLKDTLLPSFDAMLETVEIVIEY